MRLVTQIITKDLTATDCAAVRNVPGQNEVPGKSSGRARLIAICRRLVQKCSSRQPCHRTEIPYTNSLECPKNQIFVNEEDKSGADQLSRQRHRIGITEKTIRDN
jgi:hypothetical protein